MKIEVTLYEAVKGEITALEHEGVLYRPESKRKSVVLIGAVSIPMENTVTKKEPKKKSNYKGKRSNFEMWVKKLELGARFTEETFFKEYPKVKQDARGKERVAKYISILISKNKLLQHEKGILEKIGE